jgi:hypothetical protein
MTEVPANVQEFNAVAGLIFAQLYREFPIREPIDRAAIAQAMGVADPEWDKHKLPSGRSFADVLAHTISWLNAEEYTRTSSSVPWQQVTLTTKGLMAMNAVPSGLNQSLGAELTKATEHDATPDLSRIGDLIGGIFGGFTKSIGSG